VPLSPKRREAATALYETIRRIVRRLLGRTYERFWELPVCVVLVVLWIGGALMLVASALLVYLAAVLLARFVAL
jgi:hypothetical protein